MEFTAMTMKLVQRNPGTYDLYICDEIVPNLQTLFGMQRSDTSQKSILEQLERAEGASQINICINSIGGSVKEGYGIYAALLRHPARKTAYIDGVANSIASVIAMAADEIVMHPGSSMGIHNMEVCCSGNAADLRKMADSLDKLMEGSRKIYLDRSGGKLTEEKLKELLDAETILTPKECMEYGFCDRIEERRREPPPAPDEGTAPKPQEEKTLEQILESWR